jgi:hypothetical protein
LSVIYVAFDLPDFTYRFEWELDRDEAARMVALQQQLADQVGVPLDAYLGSGVIHAPTFLPHPDPVIERGAAVTVTCWALRLPAPDELSGTLEDYIGALDFRVSVTTLRGREVAYTVEARHREACGTA